MLHRWVLAAAISVMSTYSLAQTGVQSGCVQCVSTQSSSVQSNSVRSFSVQSDCVQCNCVQCGGGQSGLATGVSPALGISAGQSTAPTAPDCSD